MSAIVETVAITRPGRSGSSDCEAANSDEGCTVGSKQVPHKCTALNKKTRYKTPMLANKMIASFDYACKPPENASFTTANSEEQSANLLRHTEIPQTLTYKPRALLNNSIDLPASVMIQF